MDPLDDGAERRAVVDFERGAAEEELAGVGKAGSSCRLSMASRAGIEERVAGEDDEVAPGEARSICRRRSGVYFRSRVARVSSFSVSRRRKSR